MICPACNSKYDDTLTFCPKDGTALVPDDAQTESRVGQILADRYRIVRLLGEGGMGEVYEAEHIYIKKKVALKLLRGEITANAEAVTRFHQEALAASTIGHENIVNIDDFGRLPDGSVYLTMEYLAGEPLSDLMLKQRVDDATALNYMIQICEGLAAAHAKGIIHRDMKPENVYLADNKDGVPIVKILDFGIAKVSTADSGQNLTRTGTIFGTPHYMSPEQAMGRNLDHRTDVYSVGVIMYELFTGTVPFKAESFMGILTQHITALPTPPRDCAPDRQIHPEIERIILTAMAKEPDKRYPSMVELVEDLHSVRKAVTAFSMPVVAAPVPAPAAGGWGTAHHPAADPGAGPAPTMTATPAPTMMPTGGMQPPPGMTTAPPIGPAASVSPGLTAAQVTHPPSSGGSSKMVPILIAVLVLVGGGVAAAVMFLGKKDGEPGKKPSGGQATAPQSDMDAAAGAPDGGDVLSDMMPTGDMVPGTSPMGAATKTVEVTVRSKPSEAEVHDTSGKLCTTPCPVKVAEGGKLLVVLKKDGYLDKPVTLSADETKPATSKLMKAPVAAVTPRPHPRARPRPRPRARPRPRPRPRARPRPRWRPRPRAMGSDPFGEGID